MWKRIYLYLVRKSKKTLLLLLLFMMITTALLVCLSVRKSSVGELESLRESFGGSFTMSVYIDWNNSDQIERVVNPDGSVSRVYRGPQINQNIVEAVCKTDGIIECNAEEYMYLYLPKIELKHGSFWNHYQERQVRKDGWPVILGEDEHFKMRTQLSSFHGNSNSAYNKYFRTSAFELIEGRHINSDDKAKIIISETIAEKNELKVGDLVKVCASMAIVEAGAAVEDVRKEIDFEIVGIYRINSAQEVTVYTAEFDIADNFFFVDLASAMECQKVLTGEENYNSATFFIEDPKELDSIIAKVKELDEIEGKPFQFDIDDTVYQESASILKTLNLVLTILIAVIIISCLAILSIILSMWIQNRRREAGILLSIGIERREIIAQFMAECLIIGLIAVVLAAGVSSAVSKPVSNAVLSMITPEEEEIETRSKEELTQELLEGNFDNLGGEIHTEVKLPEEFNSTVTIGDVVLALLIEAMLIIATVYVACYRVLWMKPKDILTMMS